MDSQNKSSLWCKDACFLKQLAQREANPAALTYGHTADSNMSMLSKSCIYRNISILDQTTSTELPGAGPITVGRGRSVTGQTHLQEQSLNWFLMGACCIFRSITFPSKKNNFIFENKLLGEVAFSDNSLWGRVCISLKRKDAAQFYASWGTALLAAPPIQFPPKQKEIFWLYYRPNLPIPDWKYLADFIVSPEQSFSLY